jgi:hypothetical protein
MTQMRVPLHTSAVLLALDILVGTHKLLISRGIEVNLRLRVMAFQLPHFPMAG